MLTDLVYLFSESTLQELLSPQSRPELLARRENFLPSQQFLQSRLQQAQLAQVVTDDTRHLKCLGVLSKNS